MKKATIVVADFYLKDRLFDLNDKISNKDNCLFCYKTLKDHFQKHNFTLSTQDINKIEESEIVIFNDMPKTIPRKKSNQRFYLIAMESIAVLPRNFKINLYSAFEKVFTWNDQYVDGKKIIKINYSFLLEYSRVEPLYIGRKLACLIANNKYSSHKNELYSSRLKIVNWFEKYHPDDFSLYGADWNFKTANAYIRKIFNKLRLNLLISTKLPSVYRGMTNQKIQLLKEYKFNICYENVKNIPGYITEKIFDCFLASCVPVYWGANNIDQYIPKECYIDKKNFKNFEDLYSYINEMTESTYEHYIDNISSFLKSTKSYPFSAEYFANTITSEILNQ